MGLLQGLRVPWLLPIGADSNRTVLGGLSKDLQTNISELVLSMCEFSALIVDPNYLYLFLKDGACSDRVFYASACNVLGHFVVATLLYCSVSTCSLPVVVLKTDRMDVAYEVRK